MKRVNFSEWASPIVPVPKKDGQFRVCGDYKVTVNPDLGLDQYPLPITVDLFTSLTSVLSSMHSRQFVVVELRHDCSLLLYFTLTLNDPEGLML